MTEVMLRRESEVWVEVYGEMVPIDRRPRGFFEEVRRTAAQYGPIVYVGLVFAGPAVAALVFLALAVLFSLV